MQHAVPTRLPETGGPHVSILERLGSFVDASRERTDPRTGGILANSLAYWNRYYGFLQIVRTRYAKASEKLNRLMSATRPVGGEDVLRLMSLVLELLLEIESFYLFAKILVDRLADTWFWYFRIAKPASGSSHHNLTVGFKRYCSRVHLAIYPHPEDFRKRLVEVQKQIVEYRTDKIEHFFDPQVTHGIALGPDGKARIATALVHPSIDDMGKLLKEDSNKIDIDGLIKLIDAHIVAVVEFLETNAPKSVLLKGSSETGGTPEPSSGASENPQARRS